MKPHSRYQTARHLLIFWTLFVAIGAVGGALGMLLDPSGKLMGMDTMLPYFQILPFAEIVFQDFTLSGCALLIVNGLTNLTAAGLLFAKREPALSQAVSLGRHSCCGSASSFICSP
mgnify:CR=1 FL=1